MRVIDCAGRDALTPEEAAAVAAAARAGGVTLFPTDTLYGLGVDPGSPAGLAALFRLKGRDPEAVEGVGREEDHAAGPRGGADGGRFFRRQDIPAGAFDDAHE